MLLVARTQIMTDSSRHYAPSPIQPHRHRLPSAVGRYVAKERPSVSSVATSGVRVRSVGPRRHCPMRLALCEALGMLPGRRYDPAGQVRCVDPTRHLESRSHPRREDPLPQTSTGDVRGDRHVDHHLPGARSFAAQRHPTCSPVPLRIPSVSKCIEGVRVAMVVKRIIVSVKGVPRGTKVVERSTLKQTGMGCLIEGGRESV
jgi:hypothetical protein